MKAKYVIAIMILMFCSISVADVTDADAFDWVKYDCNGSTTGFTYAFRVLQASDLVVIHYDTATDTATTLTNITDYTVSVTNNDFRNATGGTVTTTSTYGATIDLIISTQFTMTQLAQMTYRWQPATVEDALDKSRLIDRQLYRHLLRCLRGEEDDDPNLVMTLGNAATRASKWLGFGANGEVALSDSITPANAIITAWGETLIDDADAATARNTLGGGISFDVDKYASFSAAIADIGSTVGELHIYSTQAVTTDETVPATLTLVFHNGGSLSIATTKTVTINGNLKAGLYQIFSLAGTGVATFGGDYIKELYPQWWGAVGDGTTDDITAIQAAIDAASASYIGRVKFPKGQYRITDTIYIPSYVTLVGQSGGGWLYPYSNKATHIYADLTDSTQFAISSDITVVATGLRYGAQAFPTGTNYDDGDCTKANGIGIENLVLYTDKAIFGGIKIMASPNAKIRNVTSEGFKIGMFVSASWSIVLDPIFIRAGWQGLVLQYTVNGGTIGGVINLLGTSVMMAENEIPDWNYLNERNTVRHPNDYPRKRTGIYSVYVGPNHFTNIVLSGWDIAIQSMVERTSTYGSLGVENIGDVVLFQYYSQLAINSWTTYVDGVDLIYPGQTVNLVVGNIFQGAGLTLGNWISDLHAQVNSSITFLGPGYNTDGTATGYKTPNLTHHTTNAIVECIHNSTHTNLGAAGNITLTLSSYPVPGTIYHFSVQETFELRIDPGTNAILDSSGVTDDKYKTANAVGECLSIVADDNLDWVVIAKYGTWTQE